MQISPVFFLFFFTHPTILHEITQPRSKTIPEDIPTRKAFSRRTCNTDSGAHGVLPSKQ
jgi:hypothetical protein